MSEFDSFAILRSFGFAPFFVYNIASDCIYIELQMDDQFTRNTDGIEQFDTLYPKTANDTAHECFIYNDYNIHYVALNTMNAYSDILNNRCSEWTLDSCLCKTTKMAESVMAIDGWSLPQ